jgi:hypothetical protein
MAGDSRVVLTIAHLDHQPENCDPENLRAWCQRCHLTYDIEHHRQSRRQQKALGDLLDPHSWATTWRPPNDRDLRDGGRGTVRAG